MAELTRNERILLERARKADLGARDDVRAPRSAADVLKAAALLEERAQVLRHMECNDLFEVKFKDDKRNKQWRIDLAEVAEQVQQIAETMRRSALEKRIRAIDAELAAMNVEIPAAEMPTADPFDFGSQFQGR